MLAWPRLQPTAHGRAPWRAGGFVCQGWVAIDSAMAMHTQQQSTTAFTAEGGVPLVHIHVSSGVGAGWGGGGCRAQAATQPGRGSISEPGVCRACTMGLGGGGGEGMGGQPRSAVIDSVLTLLPAADSTLCLDFCCCVFPCSIPAFDRFVECARARGCVRGCLTMTMTQVCGGEGADPVHTPPAGRMRQTSCVPGGAAGVPRRPPRPGVAAVCKNALGRRA